jgi:hypothetical protein
MMSSEMLAAPPESHHNMAVVAVRCNDCINFIGSSRGPDARPVALASAGEPNLWVARVWRSL